MKALLFSAVALLCFSGELFSQTTGTPPANCFDFSIKRADGTVVPATTGMDIFLGDVVLVRRHFAQDDSVQITYRIKSNGAGQQAPSSEWLKPNNTVSTASLFSSVKPGTNVWLEFKPTNTACTANFQNILVLTVARR